MSRSFLAHLFLNLITVGVIALMLYVSRANAEPMSPPASSELTPTTLSYQGNLTNASGQAINSPINLTFRFYNTASGGTSLWTETQSGVSIVNGLFNVELGAVNAIPESVWAENNLYLGVQVGSDGEMVPRESVGKVPVAAQAVTVPDGSIGSEKLALDSESACLNSEASIPLPGGFQSRDIPGLSLTVNLSQPSQVLVWMNGGVRFSNIGEVEVYTDVGENAVITTIDKDDPGHRFHLSGQRLLSLPAGSHTIKMRVATSHDGTFTLLGQYSWWRPCVNYVVLGN